MNLSWLQLVCKEYLKTLKQDKIMEEDKRPVKMITVEELEHKVRQLEGIKIIVRLPRNTLVPDYDFTKKYHDGGRVRNLIRQRLIPLFSEVSPNVEIEVIDGYASTVYGISKTLYKLRESYER